MNSYRKACTVQMDRLWNVMGNCIRDYGWRYCTWLRFHMFLDTDLYISDYYRLRFAGNLCSQCTRVYRWVGFLRILWCMSKLLDRLRFCIRYWVHRVLGYIDWWGVHIHYSISSNCIFQNYMGYKSKNFFSHNNIMIVDYLAKEYID